jgi:hypothetical protein
MDSKTVTCVICNKPVSLEVAKTNHSGHAVHEECYARTLAPKPSDPKK